MHQFVGGQTALNDIFVVFCGLEQYTKPWSNPKVGIGQH